MDATPAGELTLVECLELLSGQRYGRVVFSERALPAIRPVGYMMIDDHLVVRPLGAGPAAPGRDLARCLHGQVVAFEIDHADADGGWTVVVTGTARALPDTGELLAWDNSHWGNEQAAGAVAISCTDIRGRRLHALAG